MTSKLTDPNEAPFQQNKKTLMSKHIVLLGDSIFDNGVYVDPEPSVIQQMESALRDVSDSDPYTEKWQATLLAVDGDVSADVARQLGNLPDDATDLVVSVGGNDALGNIHLLAEVQSVEDLPRVLADVIPEFREAYSAMLDAVVARGLPTIVCTIYDQCPFDEEIARELVPAALVSFNDVILDEARQRDIKVIELREICTDEDDYSEVSPIEPSTIGGAKIVAAIIHQLM